MERLDCIFCGAEDTESPVVIEENGFTGRQCPNCGLIWISPRPLESSIVNIYEHERASDYARWHFSAMWTARFRSRYTLSKFKKYQSQGSLLEIGAGTGDFLLEAKRAGFDTCGIELNPEEAAFIDRELGIPCERSSLSEAFPGKQFDVIYHCNVASHLYNPFSTFCETHTRLANNGLLVFETGNMGDVEHRFLSLFPRFYYPDHLFFFSERNLRTLLELTGFELLSIHRYSIVPYLRYQKLTGIVETMQFLPRDTRIKLRALLDHCLLYHLGAFFAKRGTPQTLILVARKLDRPATRQTLDARTGSPNST